MILFFPQMPSVYVFNGVYHNASFDFTGPVPKGSIQIQVCVCVWTLFICLTRNSSLILTPFHLQFDVVLSVTNYLPVTLRHMDLVMNFHSLPIGDVELSNYTLFHDTVTLPQTIIFDTRNISFEEQKAVEDLELLASDLLKGQVELNFLGEASMSIFGIPFSFEYYREVPVNWINFFVNNTNQDPAKDRAQKYSLLFAPAFGNMQPASIVY